MTENSSDLLELLALPGNQTMLDRKRHCSPNPLRLAHVARAQEIISLCDRAKDTILLRDESQGEGMIDAVEGIWRE